MKSFFTFLIAADPKFSAPILNVTVPVSRDAILTCKVHDLVQYKVRLNIYGSSKNHLKLL